MSDLMEPVLIGHPFSSLGRGEDVRTTFRALRAVGVACSIRDIYGLQRDPDPDLERELGGHLTRRLSRSVNVFHINGDEVEQALSHMRDELVDSACNVIYPAWELSSYPEKLIGALQRFDEVWAPSGFIHDSLKGRLSIPVVHLPLASEAMVDHMMNRDHYGIPSNPYAFLFFFDFTSFIDRKNPFAVLHAFERVCDRRPHEDVRLVIKLNHSAHNPEHYGRFKEAVDRCRYRDRLIIIDRTLGNDEIRNLVRCCDSFVSLHRSEGFGRGMAEAMFLGKPVVATGYSGNMDFMNDQISCLVDYTLVPVGEDQYIHAAGQVWAEPDIDHAADLMVRLLEDREYGRRLGMEASRHIRMHFGYRALGLRYQARLEEIAAAGQESGCDEGSDGSVATAGA